MILKKLLKIATNRVQITLFDSLLDILISTLQEYRRAQSNGDFDTFKNNTDTNPFKNFKNDI